VAIRSSDVAGVGGFVLPGDRVDVLLTRVIGQGNDAPPNTVTQILAENVRVVGIDQSDNDEASKPSVAKAVTIEVTPEQAQTIALGQSVGAVSLSLRHVADVAPLARHATTVAELGFVPPVKRPPANASASAASDKPAGVPLYGPGIVRVTRVTETTGYRLGAR
jgi:pilus assembly protein CpaB